MVNNRKLLFRQWFRKFCNIDGRVSRRKYCMFTILFLSYCFIFDILNRVFYIKASVNAENKFYALYFVAVLILVTFIVKNIVFTIRRLHDLNLNGWWCIWYFLLPPIQITLCFFKGTPGPNRYGQPPT